MTKKSQQNTKKLENGSPERFGYSWNIFDDILPIHEEQFKRWTTGFDQAQWKDKTFIDVGCGVGRNSYWPMTYGAEGGCAIDVDSRTIDAAKRNLQEYPSVNVEFKSIYDLDVANKYDVAFSIGVIHHLEYPEIAIKNMVKSVRPGGFVLVWVYGFENNEWLIRYFNPLRRAMFSRLPLRLVYALSYPLTVILRLFLVMGLGKIEYFKLLRKFSFNHIRAIVYDHMIPRIARYYKKEEALELLGSQGLENLQIAWVNNMSWTIIGRKQEKKI
jgi:SAM-dependent methyltransferase